MSTAWDDFKKENGIDEPDEECSRYVPSMMDHHDDTGLMVKDGGDFMSEVRRYLSISKVKRMFNLGTELFSAAAPFLEKPTWWHAAQAVFGMGKVLVEDVEVWADDYFADSKWAMPYSSDFNQTLLNVLQGFPYERIKTHEDNVFIRICTLPNGIKVGWTYAGKTKSVDHIYVEEARLDEARSTIKQLLWDEFQGKSLVLRKNDRIVINGEDARIVFEIDDAFESKLSKRAEELAEQLKKPISDGISRSIMFYGPPGTGKSTMARTLVELMELRSFRIRIADLGDLDNSTLFEAISIFEPDAVILDDFDRANGQAKLLETLEFFQQKVKLIITTVNNRDELDPALLRPGRVDVLEFVDTMDEKVVKHLLGDFADGFEVVKSWPVAFIVEYVKRRRYLSQEEAASSLAELTQRVKELEQYRDKSDVERMLKLLEEKKAKKRKKGPHNDPLG